MCRGPLAGVALSVLAVALSACSSSPAAEPEASGRPAAATSPSVAEPGTDEVDEIPLADHARAVEALGADHVAAAANTAAQVARIALADCRRWTSGEVDPRLEALVTSEVLARAQEELDGAQEYGGVPVPSLLSHLPENDGNGHDLIADVRGGCDDGAPLRYPNGPLLVSLRDDDRLVVDGQFAMNVRLGPTLVSAGQDWVFTLERTAGGWVVSDVGRVMANVNWAPPFSG